MRLSTLSRISQRFISVNQVCLISVSGAGRNQLFSLLLSAVFSFFLNGFNPLAISDNFFRGAPRPDFSSISLASAFSSSSFANSGAVSAGRPFRISDVSRCKEASGAAESGAWDAAECREGSSVSAAFFKPRSAWPSSFQGDDLSVRAVRIFSLLRFDGGFFSHHILPNLPAWHRCGKRGGTARLLLRPLRS